MKSIFSVFIFYIFFAITLNANPPASKPINKPVTKVLNKPVAKPTAKSISTTLNNPKIKNLYFPTDTVDRFINVYGKDSLLKLIDERITNATTVVNNNIDKVLDVTAILDLSLFSSNFKLNIKTNELKRLDFFDELYSLYNKINGDTVYVSQKIDSMEMMNVDIIDSGVLKSIDNEYAVKAFVIFCNRIVKDNNDLDKVAKAIYENSKSLKINDKIHAYYLLIELYKNYSKIKVQKSIYYTKLFDELYKTNNLKMYYLDTFPKLKNVDSIVVKNKMGIDSQYQELEKKSKNYNPIKMLAYGLYANDINLQNHSEELFYLLDAQQKNGSWSLIKKFNYFDLNAENTVYGLWSLLQFREQLKSYKE